MDIERNVKQASQDVEVFLTTGGFVQDPDAVVEHVAAPKASRADFFAYNAKVRLLRLPFRLMKLTARSSSFFAVGQRKNPPRSFYLFFAFSPSRS